jgi:hypothetical protein
MAYLASPFSPCAQDTPPSPFKITTPPPEVFDNAGSEQPSHQTQIFSLQPVPKSRMRSPAHQLSAEHHTFVSGYQGPYAAQVAAPLPDNMDPAMSMQSSHLPASDQLLYTHENSTLYQGLPPEYHGAAQPFPTYNEQDFAQDLDPLHTAPDMQSGGNGLPELELKFEMKELVEVRLPTNEEVAADPSEQDGDGGNEDAAGVEDDHGEDEDAEGSDDDTVTEVSPTDHIYHNQAEDQESEQPLQASQPQQPTQPRPLQPKIYIRFSTKKKQATATKKSGSTTQENELKRPSTTSIEELVN